MCEGLFIISGRLRVIFLRVIRISQIVECVELIGLESERLLERLDGIGKLALVELRLAQRQKNIRLVLFEGKAFLKGGSGLIVAFGLVIKMPEMSPGSGLIGMLDG